MNSMKRPISYGLSRRLAPLKRLMSQYSPASSVARSGGLLEYRCSSPSRPLCCTMSIVSHVGWPTMASIS